ncbi:putative Uncharacterized 50.6 kDa protein in the 5'region of gyrA and gyrB [Actinacidiphila bryophytorum]|uniref:Uncharacterized 50.6 kDa protein in the 5'region of gyrA and gyrB n=1 Tax=Actinacidiphila bryophytorum TaxID=1436133 RepID=A0A9W4H2J6_9ACTN|nr:putative Uncharacterized 50.6 kDa protein in the 5'region of gyrA and gyrB [Actinacidiphila bryophytorum]
MTRPAAAPTIPVGHLSRFPRSGHRRAPSPHDLLVPLARGEKGAPHVPSHEPCRARIGLQETGRRRAERRRRHRLRRRAGHLGRRRRRHPEPGRQRRLRERTVRLDLLRRLRLHRRQPRALRQLRAQGHPRRVRQRPVRPDRQRAAQLPVHAQRLRPGLLRLPGRHRHRRRERAVHLDAGRHLVHPAQPELHHRRQHHLGDGLPARLVRAAHVLRRRRVAHRPRRQRHHAAHLTHHHPAHDTPHHAPDDTAHDASHHDPAHQHPARSHLRDQAQAVRQGAAGLLGELGRRRQRRPPRPRLDPHHRQPDRPARLQRHQRGLPRHPLRRHRRVAGRHGQRRQGRHTRRDVPGQGRGRDDPDVHRRRGGRHRPVVEHRRRPLRGDRRADPEAVQLRRHRHRHRDRLVRQRQHQHAVRVPGQPGAHHRRRAVADARRLRPDDGPRDRVRHRRQRHLRLDLGCVPADREEVRRQRPAVVAQHAVLQRQHVRLLRRLLRGRHRGGLHRSDQLPQQRPRRPGHHDQGPLRQAGPRPAGPARRGRRLHGAQSGQPVVELLQRLAQGPHDLVGQLGRLEGLVLRRQREVPPGPLTPAPPAEAALRHRVESGLSTAATK